jgi:VIT1/CCC1 family predicted Fe2+/Mn2+ transporter
MLGPWPQGEIVTFASVVLALSLTGWWAAWVGNFSVRKSVFRNVGISILTMGLTYLLGQILGVTVL